MRTLARYAISLAAATALALLAFPWILRLAEPVARACAEGSEALLRAIFEAFR